MEQYLKEIAKELKLIRKEMKRENDLYERDMQEVYGKDSTTTNNIKENTIIETNTSNIADTLNAMFNR